MILNTASTIIYNGSPVNYVYCNGTKIWPSAQPTPIYSWSASGSISTSTTNYGLIHPLNVSKFTWLTTATTSIDTILNGSAYYQKVTDSSGRSASNVRNYGRSSFNEQVKLYNFWLTMMITGRANTNIYSAQMTIPRIFHTNSGLGHTSTIDGVSTSSYIRSGFGTDITGSATITAISARIHGQDSTVNSPRMLFSSYGPAVYGMLGTAYKEVSMSSYWTASGVYRP